MVEVCRYEWQARGESSKASQAVSSQPFRSVVISQRRKLWFTTENLACILGAFESSISQGEDK
jgi:hypothetical protein